ncbi:Hint domain-containing protein [Roseomonas sp. HF4]|uniref:Hint domain-containing protein n=1 Tax=Roseomonas sp. HF4 TaxID=2562313 RepID=UPI0010C0F190|nr:Hint domain-containing protein [Roseomonas sp. HF4]
MSGTGWFDPDGNPRPGNAPTPGDDSFVGTEGDDIQTGGESPIISAGLGNDTMRGFGGTDLLSGDEGEDLLDGGAGDDELYGGADNDTLIGDAGDDFLSGRDGDDKIYGGEGSDTVVLGGTPGGYSWTPTAGGWIVTDLNVNDEDDGTDFIASDVEWIQYNASGDILPTPCFAAGTRIMTARGEVPVEMLRVGDLAVTLGLRGPWLRPVEWIGHRRVDCRRHPRPAAVQPIRIRAGSLGPGVPHRDLLVSPDHALYLDGALVPAAMLVDGTAAVREVAAREVRYFHVELDQHDVLLAEGAPAESWLDCGNRDQFSNGGLVARLHPDFAAPRGAAACAELVTGGPRLARILAAIAARRGDGGGGPGGLKQAG